jgi:hypothetical protein
MGPTPETDDVQRLKKTVLELGHRIDELGQRQDVMTDALLQLSEAVASRIDRNDQALLEVVQSFRTLASIVKTQRTGKPPTPAEPQIQ